MNTKTLERCLRGNTPRHRLTMPKHTIKALARKLAFEAQRGQHPNRRDAKKPKKAKKGKPPKYTRLDKAKRVTIATLHRMGVGDAEIARQIGCHRSTIKREIEQNKSQKGYRPKKAQEKAEGRIKAKATARRKFTPAQWKEAKERLEKDGWTFEQTSERARRDGRRFVCKETLYKEYYARQRLVERMSRFTLVGYSATKETDAVMAVFKALLRDLPREMVQSLTLDNGKEYAKFKVLVRDCGLDVFFAKPYHSWERGTNENRNGVVRIVLPKGSRFDNITKEQMERIDRLLNDRPLRCLGWRTPREVFTARLQYRLKVA